MDDCGSGRTGCPLMTRLAVQTPAPPVHTSKCPYLCVWMGWRQEKMLSQWIHLPCGTYSTITSTCWILQATSAGNPPIIKYDRQQLLHIRSLVNNTTVHWFTMINKEIFMGWDYLLLHLEYGGDKRKEGRGPGPGAGWAFPWNTKKYNIMVSTENRQPVAAVVKKVLLRFHEHISCPVHSLNTASWQGYNALPPPRLANKADISSASASLKAETQTRLTDIADQLRWECPPEDY